MPSLARTLHGPGHAAHHARARWTSIFNSHRNWLLVVDSNVSNNHYPIKHLLSEEEGVASSVGEKNDVVVLHQQQFGIIVCEQSSSGVQT
jgi:hypothetical protein